MLRFGALFLICVLIQISCPGISQASPESSGETSSFCFVRHLRDAIALNRSRRAAYSKMSDGASEKVSNLLILGERLALPGAFALELQAKKYEEAGIPILCEDFVAMSTVAPQDLVKDVATEIPELLALNPAKAWSDKIRDAYDHEGFEGASLQATSLLSELNSAPRFFCMARHILSSIVRLSNLAPIHDREALDRNLKSADKISRKLLFSHLQALSLSGKIDRAAAPIQAQGIPIVCGDVPEILAR